MYKFQYIGSELLIKWKGTRFRVSPILYILYFYSPPDISFIYCSGIYIIKNKRTGGKKMDEELNSWKEVYRAYGCRISFEDIPDEM